MIEDHAQGEAGLWLLRDKIYLVNYNIEAKRMAEEEAAGFEVIAHPWYNAEKQKKPFTSLVGSRHIGSDLPAPGMPLVANEFASRRFVFSPADQVRSRALCRECGAIIENVARTVRPNKTEREIAAENFWQCRGCGITLVVVLVGADERIARYRHPLPKNNPVHVYAMLVLVGVRGGLQAALTRLVAMDKLPKEIVQKHRTAARIEAAYIHHTRPGRTLGQVLETGAAVYTAEGFPNEWQKHFQGGLIGYAPREVETVPGFGIIVQPFHAAAGQPALVAPSQKILF